MPSKLTQADFDAQISGAEDLLAQEKLLAQMPEEMTKHLEDAVRKGNRLVKSGLTPRIKRFTGATASSVGSRLKVNGPGNVTGITGPSDKGKNARAHVFRFMQDGAYWKNAKRTQPWIHDLMPWVEAKFGTQTEQETRQAAFALARSIKQKGIQGQPIARPVMEEKKSAVLAFIKAATDKIVELMRVKQ